MQFIPRVTPRWEPPVHLAPYVHALERAPKGGLRIVLAAPPQHGKTEATIHAFAWWISQFPELRYAYATYSQDRSYRVGRRAKVLAERAGVQLDTANMGLWLTAADGQVLWTSVGGGLTGEPVDGVFVIDDPLAGRKEAESPTIRQNHKDWFHGSVETRVHPGASIIVMATRWHADDLSGYLVKEQGFEYINLKALADDRRPPGDNRQPGDRLWPSMRTLAWYEERRRANVWNFASLYQGEPQPRGSALFKQPTYWYALPASGFRITLGADLAYSEKSHADFSVQIEIWAVPPPPTRNKTEPKDWRFYIVDVQRHQIEAPAFALVMKRKQVQRPGTATYWYASGTEAGSAQFIQQKGVHLVVVDPGGRDKLTRAQQTSELWNLGCVLVPADSDAHPWVDPFIDEVTSFTGVKDVHDDQVDALVSGIDAALLNSGDMRVLRSGSRW